MLGLGAHARLLGPEELTAELARRVELLQERHGETPPDAGAPARTGEGARAYADAHRRAPGRGRNGSAVA